MDIQPKNSSENNSNNGFDENQAMMLLTSSEGTKFSEEEVRNLIKYLQTQIKEIPEEEERPDIMTYARNNGLYNSTLEAKMKSILQEQEKEE